MKSTIDILKNYLLKSRRRYRDSFSLAYPFLQRGGKSVLDLGGWHMAVLSAPLASSVLATTLDIKDDWVEKTFDVPCKKVNILDPEFSLEGKRFDLIFFLEVLEHLPPPTDLVMNRLRALLNPGGLLILSVPNLVYWRKRFTFFFFGKSPLKLADQRDVEGGYHHIRIYTYDECVSLLRRHGFIVHKCLSGNYRRGWYNTPFYWFEKLFKRLAHKLIFLASVE